MRGLLWAARGRPDRVPPLSNVLIAPGVTDGVELYDIACASCHGPQGEGLFGTALAGTGLTKAKIRGAIIRGRTRSGMPSFKGQFTDEQLQILVDYVYGLSTGEIEPAPATYPLPPAQFDCSSNPVPTGCGGN